MWTKWLKGKVALIECLILIGVCTSTTAYAVASGSVVFDPTNYVKNALSAQNTVGLVQNQIQQYMMQKYGIDVNLKNLSQSAIRSLMYSSTMQNASPSDRQALSYLGQLNILRRRLGLSSRSVMQQYQAYNASNLTPQQYIDQENTMAKSDASYAAASYNHAKITLKNLKLMAPYIKKQGKLVGKTVGAEASSDLLNTQMHTVVQQQHLLLKLTAISSFTAARKAKKRALEKKAAIEAAQKLTEATAATTTPEQEGADTNKLLNQSLSYFHK